ncbi:MAG: DUF2829 domain-containing protein [Parcubacteria group bacterium]
MSDKEHVERLITQYESALESAKVCVAGLADIARGVSSDRGGLSFGQALDHLKRGGRVARDGWNGKSMYLFLGHVGSIAYEYFTELSVNTRRSVGEPGAGEIRLCIFMRDAQGMLVPGWLASQADMLADDWFIIDETCQIGA